MELHEVVVMISADGRVELTVGGFTDTSCLDVTRTLERRLGAVIEERRILVTTDGSPESRISLRIGDSSDGHGSGA